jgi:hypothetical protein
MANAGWGALLTHRRVMEVFTVLSIGSEGSISPALNVTVFEING